MRLRLFHIALGLAAAILLMVLLVAAGAMVVSAVAAVLAAGLIAWIAYRVARNAIMKAAAARPLSQPRHPAVRPPSG